MEKNDRRSDMSDKVERLAPIHTNLEPEEIAQLSQEHRDWLQQRHGTLELDPVPDMNDADPYNWPRSKVSLALHSIARRNGRSVRVSQHRKVT